MTAFLRRLLRFFTRKTPWVELPDVDPWTGAAHGRHQIESVSRHAIRETGLMCPVCGGEAAALGDFSQVRRSRLGEVVICRNKREVNDTEVPCNAHLVACPDTEHGDDQWYDQVPSADRLHVFHSFVRISQKDALIRKYGEDISADKAHVLFADSAKTETLPSPAAKKVFSYAIGKVFQLSNGQLGVISRDSIGADPFYAGWAYLRMGSEDAFEWRVRPDGRVIRSDRDPMLDDTSVYIVHENITVSQPKE